MPDIVITILRLSHILAGVIWVGFGILIAWVLVPTAEKMGERGSAMMRTFAAYSPTGLITGIAALVTTVAGLLMWPFRVDGAIDFLGFGPTGDIVMAIGAVFGLLAFGHGATATNRYTRAYADAAKAYDEGPSDANTKALEEAFAKAKLHSNISAGLSLVAIVAMAGARYL